MEAIALTKTIGCQWIWIESLCMTEADRSDPLKYSTQMAETYSNSYLNIALTSLRTCFRSCFGNRINPGDYDEDYRKWPVESFEISNDLFVFSAVHVRIAHSTDHSYVAAHMANGLDLTARLLGRAWAFQQRMLAPRNLHFCASELIWECGSALACECSGLNTGQSTFCDDAKKNRLAKSTNALKIKFTDAHQGRMSQKDVLTCWRDIAEVYSSLQVLEFSDRPYALGGIALRISERAETDYLAGLWRADLARALLWAAVPRSWPSRQRISHVPSWSWMSMFDKTSNSGSIHYRHLKEGFLQDYRFQVHQAGTFCSFWYGDPFATVTFGQIEISAAALHGKIRRYRDKSGELSVITDRSAIERNPYESLFEADCQVFDEIRDGQGVLCLLVGTTRTSSYIDQDRITREHILVLRGVCGATTYRRLGVLTFSSKYGGSFGRTEVVRVKVI